MGGSELGEIRDGREGEENREGSWENIPHKRNRRIGGGSTEPRESLGQERSRREGGEHYLPSMTRGEQRATESNISSSIRSGPKRGFPRLLEEEEEEDYQHGGGGRNPKKKKGSGGALVDAVSILASAKIEGEEKKFEFLNRHMVQQGELRREELQLEREKLALEKEKAKAEQQKTELLFLQLRSSMTANTQHRPGTESNSDDFPIF